MTRLPATRVVVAPLVALPLERLTTAPKFTPSILNCTVPVGVTPSPDTAAVNVTDPP